MGLKSLSFLTAGESHGQQLTIIMQNLPAGLELSAADVDEHLRRRQGGYGRGGRMTIERDEVQFVAGVRHGRTLGSPLAMVIANRDNPNWKGIMDVEKPADADDESTGPEGHPASAGARRHGGLAQVPVR